MNGSGCGSRSAGLPPRTRPRPCGEAGRKGGVRGGGGDDRPDKTPEERRGVHEVHQSILPNPLRGRRLAAAA